MKTEPFHLPEPPDPLDALLREADEYIPDNGFTARVVENLPARRHRRWRRLAVLSTALVVGTGLVAWQSSAWIALVLSAVQQPALPHWQSVLSVIPLLAALASLVWVGFTLANEED